ncbi:MAG: endonuclease [Dysgonomonas sp.]
MRKKYLLLVLSFFLGGLSFVSAQKIILSELCDPQDNYTTDRFIEIYNADITAIDLSGWKVVAIGNSNDIFTWNLSGTIDPGQALVMGDATTTQPFTVNFKDEAWSDNNGSWNGKTGDGAKLINASGITVDYISVNTSVFENKTIVRNSDITTPSSAYIASEWTATAVATALQATPGVHNATQSSGNPSITNITINPSTILEGNPISISASITDNNYSVTSADLKWGLSSNSLTNTIPMTASSESTYITSSQIPSQAAGQTIFFTITATNSNSQTNTTTVSSFKVLSLLSISEIQGTSSISPYNGQVVVTSGIVTGIYPNYITIQNASDAWSGIWLETSATVTLGNEIKVRGTVTENSSVFAGTTLLTGVSLLENNATTNVIAPLTINAADARDEQYEGVLVKIDNANCSAANTNNWTANDGTDIIIYKLGNNFEPTVGTTYSVSGVISNLNATYQLQPRSNDDITFIADNTPPSISKATVVNSTKIILEFTEKVTESSANQPVNFLIDNQPVTSSQISATNAAKVTLTFPAIANGPHILTVNNIYDLHNNSNATQAINFTYVDSNYPSGYYDPAQGLTGIVLKQTLHNIIKDHTAKSYDYAWTAYKIADVKPNGKVWDIYSDNPNGTPAYEYDFDKNEGGAGNGEGNGFTREHTFPKSWFGGAVLPMYSDLFALYPCDAHVNGNRGTYPYGEVSVAEFTSTNGSKRGKNTSSGYSGTVFEPIDEYKGDLARTYFYMATRYYGEDSSWPGSDMVSGAELKPWALSLMLKWHNQDPVSEKEIVRNNAIYSIQNNRNPFIDHPEWVTAIWGNSTSIQEEFNNSSENSVDIYPNPANKIIYLSFKNLDIDIRSVKVFDLSGKIISEQQSDSKQLDVSLFENGLYILSIQTNKGLFSQRLVVKH